jgi:alkanesulfonate monooxygenase SsuD/methylene tetrahydromethanopterin reductase-like flavin-dependent oxidoreductase (luciferase family)
MPKVILQVYPSLGGPDEMAARRPIGRDNEAYQRTLDSLVELAQAADDLGYWGLAHTEHHLHSEGMELSPSPLMLNVHLGAHTKRLHHGQLGLVLPAHDPIRLAEEIAIADHMLKGRLFVGMARGYQSRWMNILCQKFGVGATYSDGSEADQRNRVLFAENFKIMKLAWQEELLRYDGPTYKIPNPIEGIPDWPPARTVTGTYGAPGELAEDGTTVRAVSVVPKPYTMPHPKLFQAFGASPPTIQWCGEEDVTPTILFGAVERIKELAEIFVGAHASRGRTKGFGEGLGVCRTFHIVPNGRSEDAVRAELLRRAELWEAPVWRGWYETFGLLDVMLRLPGEEGPVPAPGESIGDRLMRSGVMLGGTVDMVKRQVERFLEQLPVDYFVWLFHWGLIPRDEALRQLELFATEVMPEFDAVDRTPLASSLGSTSSQK